MLGIWGNVSSEEPIRMGGTQGTGNRLKRTDALAFRRVQQRPQTGEQVRPPGSIPLSLK